MAIEQTELSTKLQDAIRQAHFKQTNEIFMNEDTYKTILVDSYIGPVYMDPPKFRIGNVQIVIRNNVPNGEISAS